MTRSALGNKRRLPSGRWQVRMSVGYRDSDGGQRTVTRTVDTERQADIELGRLAIQMGRQPSMGDGDVTLGEYWEWYYRPYMETLARGTRVLYESTWRAHVSVFSGRPMTSISRSDVRRWLTSIHGDSARDNSTKLLRQILNAAMDDEVIDSHALTRPLRVQRVQARRRMPLWGPSEVISCIDHLYTDDRMARLVPVVLVMVGGGLRREEAFALDRGRMAWVGLPGAEVCIVDVSAAYTPADHMKTTKNTPSERVVAIGEPFSSMLYETMPEYGPIVRGSRWPDPLSPTWATRLWKSMFRENGGDLDLPFVTLNKLRATHETLMQSAGVQDTVLSSFHGHAQLSTDYRHYLSPDMGTMMGATDAVTRLFGSVPQPSI